MEFLEEKTIKVIEFRVEDVYVVNRKTKKGDFTLRDLLSDP